MELPNRKRIGVFGGTFDPVHKGHLGLAREIKDTFSLDRIVFIPVYQSPHKRDHSPSHSYHRLRMLARATESEPCFEVSDLEIERGGFSFTVDTLDALMKKEPGAEYFLILGLDAFLEIKTWKEYDRLWGMCHFVIGIRPGIHHKEPRRILANLFPEEDWQSSSPHLEPEITRFENKSTGTQLYFFRQTPLEISSSEIRERFSKGMEIKNMLPPEVENYMMRYQLY